jgi:radical SAM-linked protein
MIQQKVEIRFEKGEALRFISHHDLMRAFQRAVRRAGLPVRLTEGFNPRPRIVFPVALEVGVASLDEAAELELTQCVALPELQQRLSSTLPPGITLKSVKDLPPSREAQTVLRLLYRIHLKEAALTVQPTDLQRVLRAQTLPFARPREKGVQNVDLRPALLSLSLEENGDLLAAVRPVPTGSARPLELLSLLLQLPLEKLRHVRVTKLLMELQPPPPLSPAQRPLRQ